MRPLVTSPSQLTALALVAALAVGSCQGRADRNGDAPGYAEAAFAPYAGTQVHFYDVGGVDQGAIRAALDQLGTRDPHDSGVHDALTTWHANWTWDGLPAGGCDLPNLHYDFRIDVRLPHLVQPERLPAAVRRKWGNYVAALIDHELGHVKHASDHRDDIAGAVRASNCADANTTGLAAIATLSRFDADYDSETRHGVTQGATFPA